MSRIIFLSFCLAFVYTIGISQTVKLNVTEETTMTVSGTSTLHDWTSEVKTVTGTVEVGKKMISKGKAKKGDAINIVRIVVLVKSIISARGATMDKKTYAALKSDEHPEIIFELNDNEVSTVSGDTFTVNARGDLTIAGIKHQVEFPVEGKIISAEKMSYTGSYKLNMTDYEMEPPSAMFGQIVTGEEIEIKFELIVSK
ncbi:MAG: YceI family protein [Cyclobacteriaceae bacterium]|nr:YceI family protein [Cyclobacteriaceae bacterium]